MLLYILPNARKCSSTPIIVALVTLRVHSGPPLVRILARHLGQTFVRNLSEKVPRGRIGYNTETIADSSERPHNRSARPTSTVYQGGNTLQVLTTKCLSHIEDKTDIHAIVDSFLTRSQMEYRGVFSPSFLNKSNAYKKNSLTASSCTPE